MGVVRTVRANGASRQAEPEITIPQANVDTNRWWKYRNLRTLNLLLLIPLLSIFAQG